MKYIVAFGGFAFCLSSVMALAVLLGVVAMLLSGYKLGRLPSQFWVWDLLVGSLLGLLAGCHSFRASLRLSKTKNVSHKHTA
jgi:hypothetical protein